MRLRQRSGITGPNGASLEYPLSTAQFIAPLKNTLIPSAGYGPATFTRTTTATYFDNEGILKEVRAGAARFSGARRVSNLSQRTEYLSTWTTTNSNIVDSGFTGPNGSPVYTFSPITTAATYLYNATISALVVGRTYVLSCYVKKVDNKDFGLYIGNSIGTVTYDLDAVSYSLSGGATAGGIASVGNGFFRVWMAGVCSTSYASNHGIYKFISVAGASYYICGMQVEDVTGQSDQTPSEYVHSGKDRPNWATYTQDFTGPDWSNSNVTVTKNQVANPLDGRVNATKLTATSTAATLMSQNVVAAGAEQTLSFYTKQGSGVAEANSFGIYNSTTLGWVIKASLNYSTAAVTISNGSGTINVTDVGGGWLLVSVTVSGITIGNSLSARIGFVNNSETSGVFCYVYGPSLVIGPSFTSYVPVGADYDPHGSGVDGVKYFNTNKDGTPISSGYAKGFLAEGARTNYVLWSRDLTNAAWLLTTATTSLTATGIDGQANAASTLTATAGNAKCLQYITRTGQGSFSCYVKRRTGSGTISITRNNGTAWIDITALISTSSYTRVSIEGYTMVDPKVGFLLSTSGDAIDVDYVQEESGLFYSNPIATTTTAVTRNTDLLSYSTAGNLNDPTGTLLLSQKLNSSGNNGTVRAIATGPSISPLYKGNSGNNLFSADGTSGVGDIVWTTDTGIYKACIAWNTNSRKFTLNGSSVNTKTSYDGSWDGVSFFIGSSILGLENVYGNVSNVYLWSTALSDTNLRQITA